MKFKKAIRCILAAAVLGLSMPGFANAQTSEIVNPAQVYSYDVMTQDIKQLAQTYPNIIQYKIVGKTAYGRNIWAVRLGTGRANVFINGSHHAREWMTTTLNMYMLEKYANAYANNETFEGYQVKNLLDNVSIWFMPMVNPDGVTLQQFGLQAFPESSWSTLINLNGGSKDFKRWKANGQGVDINRQYPADWENIQDAVPSRNYAYFKGNKPLETAEAKAVVDLTYQTYPEISVAYHSSGNILYWYFNNSPDTFGRDLNLAQQLGKITGYSLVKTTPNPSGGGHTDWFIQQFGKPGFTPEIGSYVDEQDLPLEAFTDIWGRNKTVGLWAAREGFELWKQNNIRIFLQEKELIGDTQPQLVNDRTLVPFRLIAEATGSKVDWNNAARRVTVVKDNKTITLEIGNSTAMVNGTAFKLDAAPVLSNDRTLIPIRFVSEQYGLQVDWDQAEQSVLLK